MGGHDVKTTVIEFFAGSGLVRDGLGLWFETIWTNDICDKKGAIYKSNFGDNEFEIAPIEIVNGSNFPAADLAWASFPYQDLSLAGKLAGMGPGSRSDLFWEWFRTVDEMPIDRRPTVLVIENVVGWLVANDGTAFQSAYRALRERSYHVGAVVIDAVQFVPQSRPRAFVIAAQVGTNIDGLTRSSPDQNYHSRSVRAAASGITDDEWVWWSLPVPPTQNLRFIDHCEFEAPVDPPEVTARLMNMLSPLNKRKYENAINLNRRLAGTGYKRTRRLDNGDKTQKLEIRFDGVAECLRTPNGGSSRLVVIMVENGDVRTRMMTVCETARLMVASDEFKVPGIYYDGYRAMGDAVCVPVVRWLAEHLLSPLFLRNADSYLVAAE